MNAVQSVSGFPSLIYQRLQEWRGSKHPVLPSKGEGCTGEESSSELWKEEFCPVAFGIAIICFTSLWCGEMYRMAEGSSGIFRVPWVA